jgi:hypothetical protein
MPLENHPAFIIPREDYTIWRYISFEKLKSLLETKSLFFTRASKFADPFEGSMPKKEVEFRNANMLKDFSEDRERALRNIAGSEEWHHNLRKNTVVNCWHMNDIENDLMWGYYLKSSNGVALKSNISKIQSAFEKTEASIYYSQVRYINYDEDIYFHPIEYEYWDYNLFSALDHKRKQFSADREFRILHQVMEATPENADNYWKNQPSSSGILIPVDLKELIQKIIFHPKMEQEQKNLIAKLLHENNLDIKTENSEMSVNPIY